MSENWNIDRRSEPASAVSFRILSAMKTTWPPAPPPMSPTIALPACLMSTVAPPTALSTEPSAAMITSGLAPAETSTSASHSMRRLELETSSVPMSLACTSSARLL